VEKNKAVVLHAFVKKTQRTPKKSLDIALTRLKEANFNE